MISIPAIYKDLMTPLLALFSSKNLVFNRFVYKYRAYWYKNQKN
jgi:hypothetical protein